MTPNSHSLDPDLLLRQTAWLRRLAYGLLQGVGGADGVDDLLQETFLRALESPPRIESEAKLRGWLSRVARNVLTTRRRSDAARSTRERARIPSEGTGPTVDESLERVEMHAKLVELVMQLEPDDREVVVLRYFEELDPRQIAERLGTTGPAVRSRLSRALERMRARLDAAHAGNRRNWAVLLGAVLTERPPMPRVIPWGWIAAGALVVCGGVALKAATQRAALLQERAMQERMEALAYQAELADSRGTASAPEEGVNLVAPAARVPVDGAAQAPTGPSNAALAASEELPQRVALRARFVDPAGRPLAGVRLVASSGSSPRSGADGLVSWSLTEDELGDATGSFLAHADGRAAKRVQARQSKAQLGGTHFLGKYVLEAGGVVTGRVLGAKGDPAVRAAVYAVTAADHEVGEAQLSQRLFGPGLRLDSGVARTDERGEFRLEGVPVGLIQVAAWSFESEHVLGPPLEVREGAEARTPDVQLVALPGDAVIRCRVVDANGIAVADAPVSLGSADGHYSVPGGGGLTDSSGEATLRGVPGTRYRLHATHPSFRRCSAELQAQAGDYVELELPAWFEAEVVVVDPQGRPTSGVELALAGSGSIQAFDSVELAPGLYRLRTMTEGRQSVSARHGSFGPAAHVEVAFGADGPRVNSGSQVTLRLDPLPRLGGVVLSAGEPVRGARIHTHEPLPAGTESIAFAAGFGAAVNPLQRRTVVSDESGAFSVGATQSVFVCVEAEGFARRQVGPYDAKARMLEVELDAGGVVRGSVRTPNGDAVVRGAVGLSRGDGHVELCDLNSAGAYSFVRVPTGKCRVGYVAPDVIDSLAEMKARATRSADGRTSREHRVVAGETLTVDLEVVPRTEEPILRGRLLLSGVPARGWRAGVLGAGVALDSNGRFELSMGNGKSMRQNIGFSLPEPRPIGSQLGVVFDVLPGINELEWDIPVGRLKLENLPERPSPSELHPPSFVVASSRPSMEWMTIVTPDAAGGAFLETVPAGEAYLTHWEPDSPHDYRNASRVAEFVVLEGVENRVIVP